MINIDSKKYVEVRGALLETIEDKDYYSGIVEGDDWELDLTVIIYRDRGNGDIFDLVPVWWDFNIWNESGEIQAHDFKFKVLRALICD